MITRRDFLGTIAALCALPKVLIQWPLRSKAKPRSQVGWVWHGRYWSARQSGLRSEIERAGFDMSRAKVILNPYLDETETALVVAIDSPPILKARLRFWRPIDR